MKAVGYKENGPLDREDALLDINIEKPVVAGRELLVKVEAVSINPADAGMRLMTPAPEGSWAVTGFDASGVVEAVGSDVQNYKVGDEVYYSRSMTGMGTNAEYSPVDERIVGKKPTSISFAEAAAMPLTTLTAWEMLFDRLDVRRPTAQGGNVILVVGAAGGVGSIAIQLLRQLTDMTIIASASRDETKAWAKEMGAHYVIDHREPMAAQIEALGLGAPGFVMSTNKTAAHVGDIAELIAPQGRFGMIDNVGAIETQPFVMKSVSLHFELMFTRALFQTADIEEQGKLLNEVATLIDSGKVKTTMTQVAGKINAASIRQAHEQIETGSAKGKIVLAGF